MTMHSGLSGAGAGYEANFSSLSRDNIREIFVDGLRNAHALEKQALQMMQRQVERLRSYPEVEARMRAHIAETEEQHRRLDQILDEMGEDRSMLKDAAMSFMGNVASLAHAPMSDEILKNTMANFAFENYEASAYQSLLVLSEAGNFTFARPLLEQSLEEEHAMASWIEDNLPQVVLQYATLREAGEKADR